MCYVQDEVTENNKSLYFFKELLQFIIVLQERKISKGNKLMWFTVIAALIDAGASILSRIAGIKQSIGLAILSSILFTTTGVVFVIAMYKKLITLSEGSPLFSTCIIAATLLYAFIILNEKMSVIKFLLIVGGTAIVLIGTFLKS